MTNQRKGIKLNDQQRIRWLQLIRSENVGSVSFWALLEHYNSAENALLALPELAQRGGKKTIRIAELKNIEREMQDATRMGVRYICAGEPDYPELFRKMEAPPPVIAVKGNTAVFTKPAVAIVGSRNSSAAGMKIASTLAHDLGRAGFSIVSGLARGIDAAAHQASLTTGTIAVVAGGVNKIYPPEHQQLYHNILDQDGVILSEMPLSTVPRGVDFPRRNRLIAGLAIGLIVIEAAERSGSLISARFANDMGRIVFAVPGSPLDPRAKGTNNLIKNGAQLVSDAQDVIETLSPLHQNTQKDQTPAAQQLRFLEDQVTFDGPQPDHNCYNREQNNKTDAPLADVGDQKRQRVVAALSTTPVNIETLCLHAQIPLQQLYIILLELELAGHVIKHANNFVSLRPQ